MGFSLIVCCVAGGSLTTLREIELTQIGNATLHVMAHFVPKDKALHVVEMICQSDSHVKNKVMSVLSVAEDGDGICFFGDMSFECDGKIIGGVFKPDGDAASVEGIQFDDYHVLENLTLH